LIPNQGSKNNIFYHVFDAGKQEESIHFPVGDGQNHLLEQDQNSYVPNSGHVTLVSLEEQEQIANGPNNSGHVTPVSLEEQEQIANGPNNSGHVTPVSLEEQEQIANGPNNSGHVTPVSLEEQEQIANGPNNSGHVTPVSLEEQEQIANGPNNSGHVTLVSLEEQEQIANGPNNSGHDILVPYQEQEQDQNGQDPISSGTLVPYYQEQDQNAHDLTSSHTLVPYQGPFTPIKKRVLGKVNLDPETITVWKQLMDNKSSEGETKANEEKEKWWAEERNFFSGRVNAFTAIMNDIQGIFKLIGIFLNDNVPNNPFTRITIYS
jgi:hypothetical protein